MNVVVDTNVVAYHLLATEPYVDETRRFWLAAETVLAPAHWEAEMANVVWMAVRAQIFPADEGYRRLDFAGRLRIRSIPVRTLWQPALTRAVQAGISVYDTLFVELAARRRLPLATFDAKVLRAFPEIALRPAEILPS